MICNEMIEEDCGKLNGTMLKVKDENNNCSLIHVCSYCQKDKNWIEKAKIKGV